MKERKRKIEFNFIIIFFLENLFQSTKECKDFQQEELNQLKLNFNDRIKSE